ncbi:MAG: trigger factor [Chloroflexi bacterium]|nr:trigger factor [Chloroflexota bacterium]
MNITKEFTTDCQAIVTVEVDQDQMQSALRHVAQNVSRRRPLPGFRPGKAPYEMVERTFGKELLVEQAVEDLSRSLYRDVMRDPEINPVAVGQLEIVQKEPPIFKYTIPVVPKVTLGDYQSIHMQPEPVEVADADVDVVLNRFQTTHATMAPVTRPVQNGDVITVDVMGGIIGAEPADEKNLRIVVGDNKQPHLPFDAQIVGMNAGETREIDYTYPDDFEDENVRGQAAHYTVTVHDIKEMQLPELTDEFAQAVSQFKTLEQFKSNIRISLHREMEHNADVKFANEVLQAVTAQAEIAYPPVMLQQELENRLAQLKEDIKRLGLTWDNYLRFSGKTEEQVKEDLRPQAEQALKQTLVVGELMQAEKITVSREEVNADIERRVRESVRGGAQENVARKAYTQKEARDNIAFNLRFNKVIHRIVAIATGATSSGLILTPDMLRGENAIPTGLITDPAQVRRELEKSS